MGRALDLAARGDYRVGTNPRVGAVVVRDGEVVAEGFHAERGGPHAEAAALAELAAGGARGATMYVTLEPCGPFPGKLTPPCVEGLLSAGLARLVVAMEDPHPGTAGRSLARLRQAGVAVEVGLLEERARALNGPFLKAVAGVGLPYVTAKWAMTLDGKIACVGGHSQWISGPASRAEVHALRGEVDAVLVGAGTARADDPLLTRRDVPGGDPLRVVVDSRARLSLESRLVATARTAAPVLLATTSQADPTRRAALADRGVEVCVLPEAHGRVDPNALLGALGERGLRHVLVEGGGDLLGSLFAAGLVDRVLAYVAPRVLGGAAAPSPVGGAGVRRVEEGPRLQQVSWRTRGDDLRVEGHVKLY